jgi:hypothetical protein
MILWLLLGYVLISVLFGVVVGTAIRMQGGGDSARGRRTRRTAQRAAAAAAESTTGDRAGLALRVATGR